MEALAVPSAMRLRAALCGGRAGLGPAPCSRAAACQHDGENHQIDHEQRDERGGPQRKSRARRQGA